MSVLATLTLAPDARRSWSLMVAHGRSCTNMNMVRGVVPVQRMFASCSASARQCADDVAPARAERALVDALGLLQL